MSSRKRAQVSRPASPIRARHQTDARKTQSPRLQTQPALSRPEPTLGPIGSWPCPLTGQHKLQHTWDPIPNCVRNCSPRRCDTSSGTPGPCSQRPQAPALPASGLALAVSPSSIHQWTGKAVGFPGPSPSHQWVVTITRTMTAPQPDLSRIKTHTSKLALSQGAPRALTYHKQANSSTETPWAPQ